MDNEVSGLNIGQPNILEGLKRALIKRGAHPNEFFEAVQLGTQQPLPEVRHQTEPAPEPAAIEHADEDQEKLLDITANAQEVLFKAETVFPFTLFPDTVTIDREKVTIANRFFFKVATINSTPIADVQSVEADVGPFFGTVKTISKYFMNNPREVHFLKRADALRMQHLLQGYIIAHHREVDCNSIDKEQLVILLNDLGQGVSD